jgi:RNA polymerase II elongation factor ELL
MSTAEFALVGAPDTLLGTPRAKSAGVQAMQFTMTNEILEELLDCVKNGKPPQVLFGHNPVRRQWSLPC